MNNELEVIWSERF